MENKNTQILKEIETNTEMGLVQSEKIANAVDGLEPVMEGILLKTNELVEETKNAKPQQIVINVEGDVESIKGEKGDTPEVDYDAIDAKLEEMHKESMEIMHKELIGKVREDTLTIAEAIKPELLHEVEEKMTEYGHILLVDIKNVEDKVAKTESQIDVTDSNLKKLEKRVGDIKIPNYDLSPYAKTEEVAKKVSDVKKTIDEKVAETAKSIETLKGEVEKKVSDLEEEQTQRLQKVASKTVSLQEIDNVNLDGLTITNGKYDLGSGGGGSFIVETSRTLTQAEIVSLHTTPITLIEAQGVGTIIIPYGIVYWYHYGTSAFDNSPNLTINYNGANDPVLQNFGTMTGTEDIVYQSMGTGISMSLANQENLPITVRQNGGGITGGVDSTVTIYITYYVITV